MLIENVDSLKQWLVQKLTPICDAEPTALAKYVCALVRKEKPESELKEICNDQLDVFLQQKTKPFVDELFEGLRSKVYDNHCQSSKNHQMLKTVETGEIPGTTVSGMGGTIETGSKGGMATVGTMIAGIVETVGLVETVVKEEKGDVGHAAGASVHVAAVKWMSVGVAMMRGTGVVTHQNVATRLTEGTDAGADRAAPVASVDLRNDPGAGRIEPDSRGSTPTQDNGHYPAVVTSTSSLPSLVTVPHKPTEPPPPGEGPPLVMPGPGGPPPSAGQARVRCQNFDEKGFCMLGDLCPYDHGMDPVVVEDIGIPNVLSFPPPPPGHPLPPAVPANMSVPPPRPGFLPPGMTIPPPGAITLRPHIAPRLPAQVEPYQPEGYNPEAPAITGPPARQPFWAAGPPPGVPHPPFPQPGSRNTPPPPRRDLVAVPTQNEDVEDAVTGESEPSPPEMSSRIVVPAKRTHAEMEGAMGMGPGRMVQRSFVNPRHSFAQQARGMRRGFDFNRLGGFNRQQYKHENTTLEVRKIPAEFNTIAKLNEHFGKFGNLTNIQVKFSGDPCAALISYSRNEEAARAYHSSEPVFNNRFIKLFWHRPSQTPGDANAGGEQSTVSPASAGVASRLGPMNQPPFQAHTADSALVEPIRAELAITKGVPITSRGERRKNPNKGCEVVSGVSIHLSDGYPKA
ncbi:hypothetical protein BaRGS_00012340 [Batillaria attramentaria]|uniref:C3H1-type domain-containing protein n=1 Tax=Batillaria attramentaria TaxID=370345 RepID=A0ABD0LAL5_9CAEN